MITTLKTIYTTETIVRLLEYIVFYYAKSFSFFPLMQLCLLFLYLFRIATKKDRSLNIFELGFFLSIIQSNLDQLITSYSILAYILLFQLRMFLHFMYVFNAYTRLKSEMDTDALTICLFSYYILIVLMSVTFQSTTGGYVGSQVDRKTLVSTLFSSLYIVLINDLVCDVNLLMPFFLVHWSGAFDFFITTILTIPLMAYVSALGQSHSLPLTHNQKDSHIVRYNPLKLNNLNKIL
jgi:hypothetical protein